MKSKDYADKFKASVKIYRENPQKVLMEICRDLIKEANQIIFDEKPHESRRIAEIWNGQVEKWEEMTRILGKYQIKSEGFLKLIKEKEPKMYFQLVSVGMKKLKEDIDPPIVS